MRRCARSGDREACRFVKPTRVLTLLALALSGSLILPVVAYWVGGKIVGAYAGPRGLATYIGSIYRDAADGSPLALAMVTGPVLVAAIWALRGWGLRHFLARPARNNIPE